MDYTIVYSDELYHHGIKGQRWGIRRFQNKDGTRTPAGRKRYAKVKMTTDPKAMMKVYKTLSPKEREFAIGSPDPKMQNRGAELHAAMMKYNRGRSFVATRFGKPVSILYLSDETKTTASATIMTRSGEKYRNKGYASSAVQAGLQWLKDNNYSELYWDVDTRNTASIELAKKSGLELISDKPVTDKYGNKSVTYRKKLR